MKILKIAGLALAALLTLLLLAAWIVPTFFEGTVRKYAQQQLNERLQASVEFADLGLSFFRDFPRISLVIRDYRVVGEAPFKDIELLSGEAISVSFDLFSILRRRAPVEVVAINLKKPRAHILILEDGQANYNILKSDPGDSSSSAAPSNEVLLELKSYSLEHGQLVYEDRGGGTFVSLNGLDHSGSGNFSNTIFQLATRTAIEEATIRQGALTYLSGGTIRWQADLEIDGAAGRYTLLDNLVEVNEFPLHLEGFVEERGVDYFIDLTFESPNGSFKRFLSLVPSAYTSSFSEVAVAGQFAFSGEARGIYGMESEIYPAFVVDVRVSDGQVQYPDLDLPISDIALEARVESPSQELDDLIVEVGRFAFGLGPDRLQGDFSLRRPLSDPALRANLQGTLNLANWQRAFPLEEVEELSGRMRADMSIDTRYSLVEARAFDQITAAGSVALENVRYRAANQPAIQIERAVLEIDPRRLLLRQGVATLGRSDLKLEGSLNNYLAYFRPEDRLDGTLVLRSTRLDLNEWLVGTDTLATANAGSATEVPNAFDAFRFTIDAEINTLRYDTFSISNLRLRGAAEPNLLDVQELSLAMDRSDMRASGMLTGMMDYYEGTGRLAGNLDIRSTFFDLNAFMPKEDLSTAGEEEEELSPILLPERTDLALRFSGDRLLYGHFDLRDVAGQMQLADRQLSIGQARAAGLGGTIELQGDYDTRDPEDPRFNLKLDLNRLDFRPAFQSINTFAALAPIGRFVEGTFNANFLFAGSLQPDLMPDLSTLSAQGYLETLSGVIRQFGPLKAIGERLNLPALADEWRIQDTRNWFEVRDGMVRVQPFEVEVKQIPMTISGYHGLIDPRMDYDVEALIPRELLAQSSLGQAADKGLRLLEEQAARLGLDVQAGGDIRVGIDLQGTIRQPEVGLRVLGTEAPGASVGNDTAATAPSPSAGDDLGERGKAMLDSLVRDPSGALDSLLDSNSVKGIKNALEKWNPFGRKPKRDTSSSSNL